MNHLAKATDIFSLGPIPAARLAFSFAQPFRLWSLFLANFTRLAAAVLDPIWTVHLRTSAFSFLPLLLQGFHHATCFEQARFHAS